MALQDAGATDEFTFGGPIGITDAEEAGLILRLNYGLAAVRLLKARVTDGYYMHTFHVELPEGRRTPSEYPASTDLCSIECQKFKKLRSVISNMTRVMELSVDRVIEKIYKLLPNREVRKTRTRRPVRGLFNFVGIVNHYLWGTATDQSVNELKEEVKIARNLAEMEAENVRNVKQGLATVSRLQNTRIDNLKSVLNLERQTIFQIYNTVKQVRASASMEIDTIAMIAQRITSYMAIHDDLRDLEQGVEELIHDELSAKIVPVDQIEKAINIANNAMGKKKTLLCLNSPEEVYASSVFDFARFTRDLVIRIFLPYAETQLINRIYSDMNRVYKVIAFPMAVPGSQGLISELKSVPRLVVVNIAQDRVGIVDEIPANGLIRETDVN
jgi:hypothetical protein